MRTMLLLSALAAFAATAVASPDVKEGEWEFTTNLQIPGLPKLPEGMKLPPGLKGQNADGSMSVTRRSCVTKDKLVPPSRDERSHCQLVDQQQNGNEVTWRVECTTEHGTMTGIGKARYAGESMTSTMTMTGNLHGQAVNNTVSASGHYVGACPAKP